MPPNSGVNGIGGGDTAGRSTSMGNNGGGRSDDWASFVTAKLEAVVSLVRDRTVVPITKGVQYAIFGLVAIAVGTLLAVFFAVGLIRVLDAEVFHRRVWASYLVLAGIFAVSGLLLSRMRHPRT